MDDKNLRLNCWEFKNCGRQPGGIMTAEFGICPAATERRLDGIHHGINAGRACWAVAGTMCSGNIQGTFAQKYKDCGFCAFYDFVKFEEGEDFVMTINLIKRIN